MRVGARIFTNLTIKLQHSHRSALVLSLLLLLILLYAPLPFASVLPRDLALLQALSFLALALACGRSGRAFEARLIGRPVALLLLLAGWGLLQSLPWPAFLVGVLSPQAHANAAAGQSLLGLAPAGFLPPSLAPALTRQTALHLVALAALLFAAGKAGAERASRRLLLGGLLAGALAQVLLGAEGFLTRSGRIWGIDVAGDGSRLRGTFVNSDHFAFYAGMAALLATAWVWWSLRRAFRDRAFDEAIWLLGPPLLLFLVFFAAVAFSGSRAGMVALILGLLGQGALLARHYRRWQVFGVTALAILVGLAGVGLFGWQRGFVRFQETSAYEVTLNERLMAYRASLHLLGDYWLTGTGLGTFDEAFPRVQPAAMEASWEHAHSDVLELLLTGGLPALPLLAAALYVFGRRFFVVAHEGRRSEDRAFGVAAFGIFVFVAAFSLVDFGLTLPANNVTVVILFGLAFTTGTGLEAKKRSGLTVFLPKDASSAPFPAGNAR